MAPVIQTPLEPEGPAGIGDSYELSPTQQGMLFQALASPDPGMYTVQVSYTLRGAVDVPSLIAAWKAVVARHPVLRTSFRWDDGTPPAQIVHAGADLEIHLEDWDGIGIDEQRARLTGVLRREASRGFDLTRPPLLRLALIRCAANVYQMVVVHHHLLMDGSCKPALFTEVFAAYDSLRRGEPMRLPLPHPYRRYIEWLRERDLAVAQRHWQQALADLPAPARLWPATASPHGGESSYLEHEVQLDASASDAIRQYARQQRLTIGAVLTGMWALVLMHGSGSDDVVFGMTVNGRPSDLEDCSPMLGLFINTVPVRARRSPAMPAAAWLRSLAAAEADARDYDYPGLSQIQRWSGVPRGQPLFETIVVIENNPGYGADVEHYGDLAIDDVRPLIRNSFPLTLRCVPHRTLTLQLLYDDGRFASATVRAAAERVRLLLLELPRRGNVPIDDLLRVLAHDEQHRVVRQEEAFQQHARDTLRSARRRRRTEGGPPS